MAKPIMKDMRVTLGDEQWIFRLSELDLLDAFALKSTARLTPQQLLDGAMELDPAALQALIWFLRFKDGNKQDIATINFRIFDLDVEPVKEEATPPPLDPPSEDSESQGGDSDA